MILLLLILPLPAALLAWLITSEDRRPLLLPVVAVPHFLLSLFCAVQADSRISGGWIDLDPLGAVVLLTISLLFLCCAWYAVGYLRHDRPDRSNRVLVPALLLCLAAMTLVCCARHLGLLWVAVAATTLTMAPLVYFNRNARSIEATWKYLMIGSVGIALALLGVYFLAYATLVAGLAGTLNLDDLLAVAPALDRGWLKAAFIFLLTGFGAKLGLAPLHTWKPDAYGEAPGLVGALLAGGLTNCGFLALMRVVQVMTAAGGDDRFFRQSLLAMGLFSMALAAVFLVRQADFKRLLAYSSVEHVGILALALGLGKGALFGMLLHLVGNGLLKGVMFLSSGNLHRAYGSKSTLGMRGALQVLPWSGSLFLAGFLAISAFPPSLIFLSELGIAASAFRQGNWLVGGLFLAILAVVFLGMAPTVLGMVLGPPSGNLPDTGFRDRLQNTLPPACLLLAVVLLTLWMPPFLGELLLQGADLLGGMP